MSTKDKGAAKKTDDKKAAVKEDKKATTTKETTSSTGVGNIMDDLTSKQAFKKFSYRGEDITKLLAMNMDDLARLFRSRQRRRLKRKLHPRYVRLLKKLVEVKKKTPQGEKPKAIKTHLRDCIVLPSMVQSIVNVHTGKAFASVEVKPEMIGYYLGEFAMTYKRVVHGKPGVGATHSSKFVPIK
jgi:small subunit ribosomal protein S15e